MDKKTLIKKIYFGKEKINDSQIFILRQSVYAMVNIKPFKPGHVLVVPTRVELRLCDLSEKETLELWVTVQ